MTLLQSWYCAEPLTVISQTYQPNKIYPPLQGISGSGSLTRKFTKLLYIAVYVAGQYFPLI